MFVGSLAGLVGLVVATRIQPTVLLDDFAITARYAARIAGGDGWTYNPGDRTNGASAPLYTLLLAAFRLLGVDIVTAARLVGAVSYASCVGFVGYLGVRISGVIGGSFAAGFLLVWLDFGVQGLSGMESAFAAALGLSVIVAIVNERRTLAGVLLGLAVLTKLDAGMLAVAVVGGHVLVERKVPWRLALTSVAVAVPWFAFSWIYFGSPLPNSMTSKLSGAVENPATEFDRFWVIDLLRDQRVLVLVALALASAACAHAMARRRPHLACGLHVALFWPVLHLAAFSLLDLGDRYPWYLTVLYPPLALCAGCTLGWSVERARAWSRTAMVGALAVAVVVAGYAVDVNRDGGSPRELARRISDGSYSSDYLEFEQVRRDAGRRVAELAEPGDVIATCYGWVAFEALDHPIFETCPLNTREEVGPVRWVVTATYPSKDAPERLDFDAEPVEALLTPEPHPGRMDIGEVTTDGEDRSDAPGSDG